MISLPVRLDMHAAIRLAAGLETLESAELTIDCTDVAWVEPLGMLYLTFAIRRFFARGGQVTIENAPDDSYAAHMGLFDELRGASDQAAPAHEGETYVAITDVCFDDVPEGGDLYCELKKRAEQFTRILLRAYDNEGASYKAARVLELSLFEVMRNAYEHAGTRQLTFCAQSWKTQDRAELAVGDQGIGIQNSLLRNPDYSAINNVAALQFCTMPAVSVANRSRGPRPYSGTTDSLWDNEGWGLYLTRKACEDGGRFALVSSGAGIIVENNKWREFSPPMVGTLAAITIKPSVIKSYDDLSENWRNEAGIIKTWLATRPCTTETAQLAFEFYVGAKEM